MGHDPGLVVRGAPAVKASVLFDGGEGLRSPQGFVAHRLNVMMGVQQDGGFSFGGRTAGDDGRPTGRTVGFVRGQHLDLTDPGTPKEFGDGLGASLQGGALKAGPGNPGYGNELLEPCKCLVEGTVYR
ncbi:hypothetical protein NicSoilC5_07030 [Arthrobacter sp. NicSoilC5]|nr:hypothetical protein NicSoilC5_07030 [Arthrobacter sp. NicSoilC5]